MSQMELRSDKQLVEQMLKQLPPNCTLADIQYHQRSILGSGWPIGARSSRQKNSSSGWQNGSTGSLTLAQSRQSRGLDHRRRRDTILPTLGG